MIADKGVNAPESKRVTKARRKSVSVNMSKQLNGLIEILIGKQSGNLPFVFDFTQHAYKNDPLKHLFSDWKPYYNLKFLICRALNPNSILEIGVRYGYSAAAFLSACPNARYTGLDNYSASFGGVTDAYEIAKEALEAYNAEIIVADSQQMRQFPGGFYDVIHVDGQQDGNGTIHDMELAAKQCEWIWVDGCFWTKENLLATAYFLDKYKNFIDFSLSVPGYAGEMLIRMNDAKRPGATTVTGYKDLPREYSSFYYLNDCGGYDCFKKHKGERLDERLQTLFDLADVSRGERVLDIGCGRGELSYFISKHTEAERVVGVDYSADAVKIARENFLKEGAASESRLDYEQSDILTYASQAKFDKITAADVIEHIEQTSLEKMFERISSELLSENGVFIAYTPNRLQYDIFYEMRRREVKRLGVYLPKNPRTVYEDLVNINEQSRPVFHETLKKYFKYVYTWLPLEGDFLGTLRHPEAVFDSIFSNEIYALASNAVIDIESVYGICEQHGLHNIKPDSVKLTPLLSEVSADTGQSLELPVIIENKSDRSFASRLPHPVYLAYHINDLQGNTIVFDGLRTMLSCRIKPNTSHELSCDIKVPAEPGEYSVKITLVQEQCFWFEDIMDGIAFDVRLRVNRK